MDKNSQNRPEFFTCFEALPVGGDTRDTCSTQIFSDQSERGKSLRCCSLLSSANEGTSTSNRTRFAAGVGARALQQLPVRSERNPETTTLSRNLLPSVVSLPLQLLSPSASLWTH